jgi:phage FluMu protein Com
VDTRRSQDLDVEGIGHRQHVDIHSLKETASSLRCPTCEQPLAQVGARHRSVTWYCARCDVFRETTVRGSELRVYKKEANQIINLAGDR